MEKYIDLLVKAAEIIIERKLPIRMEHFRSDDKGIVEWETPFDVGNTRCGTAGCFLAWLPATGIPEFSAVKEDIYWWDYGNALFENEYVTECHFLFGPYWPDSAEFNLARAKLLKDAFDSGNVKTLPYYEDIVSEFEEFDLVTQNTQKYILEECKKRYPEIDLSGVVVYK